MTQINLRGKLALITEPWRPKIIGALNGNVVDPTFTAPDGVHV